MVPRNLEKSRNSPPQLLVFGCGYLGIQVARQSVSAGQVVWATTRRGERAEQLASMGLRPLVADWDDARTLARLPPVDQVLVAVSYDRSSERSRRESQVGGLGRLLDALPGQPQICYISTTGVYHQSNGEWVDEHSPSRPRREGGQVHLEAENLLARRHGRSAITVLRLAGIYGPGRVPRAADVVAGRPIASAEEGFLNLIHVADAAAAVRASWRHAKLARYVVADDEPVVRGEFYREIARQCGVAPPRFEPPESGAANGSRSDSNKRIWNRRMKRDLVPRLSYPTFREGLRDVLGCG